jgi:hypothetical protein
MTKKVWDGRNTSKSAKIHPAYAKAGSTSPAEQKSYITAHEKGETIQQKGKETN